LSETVTQSAFDKFIQQYNETYIVKCKELGQKQEYTIDIDNKPTTFVRKRLTTRAFNELEASRGKVERENRESNDGMENANRQANLYLEIAQAYLTNKETGQPITKEEFENCFWEDIKLILDACHLRTMMGSGNLEAASKT
jgi:hypothetical protein